MLGCEGLVEQLFDVNKSLCAGALSETFTLHNNYRRQSVIFIVTSLICDSSSCAVARRMKSQADVLRAAVGI